MRYVQIITIALPYDEALFLDALCGDYARACATLPGLTGQVWHANPHTHTVNGVLQWLNSEATRNGSTLACAAIMAHHPLQIPPRSRIVTQAMHSLDRANASPQHRPVGLVEYPDGYDPRG